MLRQLYDPYADEWRTVHVYVIRAEAKKDADLMNMHANKRVYTPVQVGFWWHVLSSDKETKEPICLL